MKKLRLAIFILIILLGFGLIVWNYEVLMESFGPGPPYYSRTTNMDKWFSPFPDLLIFDACLIVIIGVLLLLAKKLHEYDKR